MTAKEILDQVKTLKNEKTETKKIRVAKSDELGLDVSLSKLKTFSKEIGRDAAVADELYESKMVEAQVLATQIDDANSYTRDELIRRAESINSAIVAQNFGHEVLSRSPFAVQFIDEWSQGMDNELKTISYYALEKLAKIKNCLSQAFYFDRINIIGRDIHQVNEMASEAMLAALKAMGERNPYLKKMSEKTLLKMDKSTILTLNNARKSVLKEIQLESVKASQ